jgi:hypothetical protein
MTNCIEIDADTLPLANRRACQAICQALGDAGVPPGRGFGAAARDVWTERKAPGQSERRRRRNDGRR